MTLGKKIILTIIILALLLITFFAIIIMFPARIPSKQTPQTCTNNLHAIGTAASVYMMDNESWITSFQDLIPDYLDQPKAFACPESKTQSGKITNPDEWSSYTLITNPAMDLCVWVFCPAENHKSKLTHVLLTDGTTKEVDNKEFKELLKKN